MGALAVTVRAGRGARGAGRGQNNLASGIMVIFLLSGLQYDAVFLKLENSHLEKIRRKD